MDILSEKSANSTARLDDLRKKISSLPEVSYFENLTIFATGSYARGEASTHSDIDLFFLNNSDLGKIPDVNIRSIKFFAKMIEIAEELNFPKFSNDGEYLKIIEAPKVLKDLGGANDDYLNHFTARLLMLLESKPIHNTGIYESILRDILNRYFEDYPDHPENFRPTFLVNDIVRFWKTLCLNYENKRNQPSTDTEKVISQKIKNLKLKFSRMLTCFGSICYIASQDGTMDTSSLLEMTRYSPLDRLKTAATRYGKLTEFNEVEEQYKWFLTLTNISEYDLKEKFNSKDFRTDAFDHAKKFGGAVFDITNHISSKSGYLRYLLV